MSASNALFVGREVGQGLSGLGRLMIRVPILFAILAWLAFGAFAGLSKGLAANPHETRQVRSECGLSGRAAGGPGCELGSGAVVMEVTYDHTRTIAAMDQGAARSLQVASVFTVGAIAVAFFSLFGGSRRAARQPRRYVGRAVEHVQSNHARAQRDVATAKARAGKVGEWRRKRIVRRWSAEAAAGQPHSDLGALDRWVMRQEKPTKVQRKANRAAKKIGNATEKARADSLDAEWATEMHRATARLDPTDGPPLSPRQRTDYADRQADEAEANRKQVEADVAAMFDEVRS